MAMAACVLSPTTTPTPNSSIFLSKLTSICSSSPFHFLLLPSSTTAAQWFHSHRLFPFIIFSSPYADVDAGGIDNNHNNNHSGGRGGGKNNGDGGSSGDAGDGDDGNARGRKNKVEALMILAEAEMSLENLSKDFAAVIQAWRIPRAVVGRFLELQKSTLFRWLHAVVASRTGYWPMISFLLRSPCSAVSASSLRLLQSTNVAEKTFSRKWGLLLQVW